MTSKQALEMLDAAISKVNYTREQHLLLMQAIKILSDELQKINGNKKN
jgi:hypothetical protein